MVHLPSLYLKVALRGEIAFEIKPPKGILTSVYQLLLRLWRYFFLGTQCLFISHVSLKYYNEEEGHPHMFEGESEA